MKPYRNDAKNWKKCYNARTDPRKEFQPRMERIITDEIEGMQQRNPISSLIRAHQ